LICVPLLLVGCNGAGDAAEPDALIQQLGTLDNRELDEASGLALSTRDSELLWVINDDGPPLLYAISRHGKHRGQVHISDAANQDWEDLAAFIYEGESYLVVADTGDNEGRRPFVTLYVVAEPGPTDQQAELAWRINYTYPDGPRDAESLAVDIIGKHFYVLSKRDIPAVLYSVPLKPDTDATVVATRLGAVAGLPQPSAREKSQAAKNGWSWQPTAMDFARDGRRAVILTYGGVYIFARSAGQDWPDALGGTALELKLGRLKNAEAILLDEEDQAALLTVEKRHAPLLRIDLSSAWLLHENNNAKSR
jgi:hypothetical protein